MVNVHFMPAINAANTESLFKGGMKPPRLTPRITPRLAPAPRVTLWVPSLIASGLGVIFLSVLAVWP